MKRAAPSSDTSPSATAAPSSSSSATAEVGETHTGAVMEPRYIRLPDALYSLRHRYPSVTNSVFLECTRCHQWVVTPVLREIPREVHSAAVSSSAAGLDPIRCRTEPHGPLRHTLQDQLHRREELASDTGAPQWRSPRLQARQSQHASPDTLHNGDAAAAERHGSFEAILEELRRTGRTRRAAAEGGSDGCHRYPLLYIPNPDTFICAGWQCAWDADALADLRREWMQHLYAAAPAPSTAEAGLSAAVSSSPDSSAAPPPSAEQQRQRRAALNDTLARELHMVRTRRGGGGGGGGRGGTPLPHTEQPTRVDREPLPVLPLSDGGTAPSPRSHGGPPEADHHLSRMQSAWVREAALRLLRSAGAETGEEESQGNVLSAYCWAVCDACGKLRRVAQPFPGGAPFVCAMAVTTSSSCRAARDKAAAGVDQACGVSELEGLMQCNTRLCEAELIYAALSSPFLSSPLRSQLLSLQHRHTGGDGAAAAGTLTRSDVARELLTEPLLRTIQRSVRDATSATSTSGPPHRAKRRAGATVPTAATPSAATAKARRTTPALSRDDEWEPESADAEVLLLRCLPILGELARTIKKRSIGAFVRQLQLTPAQIQAKREAVMRDSFLGGHESTSAVSGGGSAAAETAAAPVLAVAQVETPNSMDEQTVTRATRAVTATAVVEAVPGQLHKATEADPAPPTEAHPQQRQQEQPNLGVPRKRGRPRRPRPEAAVAAEPTPAVAPAVAVSVHPPPAPAVVNAEESAAAPSPRRQRVEEALSVDVQPMESAASVAAPPVERRGRGRPPGSGKAARKPVSDGAASPGADKDAWEVVHWVQCDLCSKWRIVPQRVPARVKFWECKMRHDTVHGRPTTCDDPDDAELAP
ncbi:CW-type Zinc Finger [Novymonas esmeraldas]|uniref:CW-type Zinc Finger n=1 Tax=Novymonas esmeraldas TaxID=1808958 RepID=A0AAW0EN93_9TRYP